MLRINGNFSLFRKKVLRSYGTPYDIRKCSPIGRTNLYDQGFTYNLASLQRYKNGLVLNENIIRILYLTMNKRVIWFCRHDSF